MQIVDLSADNPDHIEQAAHLLVVCFRDGWPDAWPTQESARDEVMQALQPGHISRVALDATGTMLGWIGARDEKIRPVWEVHPLAVHPDYQNQGIGLRLLADLEAQVFQRGGVTLLLGSDDETNMTSLGGVELYPDPLAHLATLQNRRNHPYSFYLKAGFVIVGIIPDANGWGKPDILFAKRVQPHTREAGTTSGTI